MKTTAIRIEGQIISPELFEKLDSAEIKGQATKDFGFDQNVKVKEEIQRAWADAKDQWHIFQRRLVRLDEKEYGTTETRKYWIIPLLDNLGYVLELGKAEMLGEKSYAISHRAKNLDRFPIHIMGINDSLDKRRETSGPKMSPHALIQDYLNQTEHLYAVVTNGLQLRILRDSGKLIRLTYLEFDLQQMLEDDLYAEFSIMYRLIHSSRMPQKMNEGDLSLIEQYHQDSLESGARIREKLSSAVEKSIISAANGFLKHKDNSELREVVKSKSLSDADFYHYLLRFIYRILFLLVIEERDIVYGVIKNNPEQKKKKEIYYAYYSISRLRKLAEKVYLFDERLEDLWIALRNTFKIFGSERLAEKLGIYPLDGELFGYGALGVLSNSNLDNQTLLEVIRNLCMFENNKTHAVIRVNYAALNVEEFGSVYEGLLEKDPSIISFGNELSFSFVGGTGRSSSGSHYTPEELVQPLIKHSLDYVIEDKLKNGSTTEKQEGNLLSIKVCDVACGSGHILLGAARRIAIALTKVRTGEDQPSPEPYRKAMRDVINQCIYGVDKNPLAVELCKVALWLEAHNPGMPLNFLDHKIKCGDSIVGLARIEELQNGIATEAFKTLPEDNKEIAKLFREQNKSEIKNRTQNYLSDSEDTIKSLDSISHKFNDFNILPDDTVENVAKKREAYNELKGSEWWGLKEAADIQTAQFFIPKTKENKEYLTTDASYFRVLARQKQEVGTQSISYPMAFAQEKGFFHWFLEFPEIMQEGGFDCILGNPPFLGGLKVSSNYGYDYLNWIHSNFFGAKATCDLVAYFFRRDYSLIKNSGYVALIATNTISQGDTRLGGLDYIINSGQIIYAIRSMKWPGLAAVEVSLVSIYKGIWRRDKFLNNKKTSEISAFLDNSIESQKMPLVLKKNENKSFIGSFALGNGFIIEKETKEKIIRMNERNNEVIFHFINGNDINNNIEQYSNRFIINFFDQSQNECLEKYKEAFEIVEKNVKPERMKNTYSKSAKEKWWLYERPRLELYKAIADKSRCIVTALTGKNLAFSFIKPGAVFSHATGVIASENSSEIAILQSTLHEIWAWKYCSSMGISLRYTPSDGFQTFPYPQNFFEETEKEFEEIGEEYHEFRRQLMLDMQIGLTKTYNLFHDPECNSGNIEKAKEIREFKQATLQISLEEAVERVEKLRELHKQMDEAVLEAYGWGAGTTEPIDLAHDFYEVDYLPENDRVRYTISPEARKEVLKRLLELNHKIHAEEVAAGLWDKKKTKEKGKSKKKDTETEDLFGG